jgi:hypothetical protein
VEAIDAGAVPAQTKDFGLPNIPGCHVSQSSHSFIFMLDTAIAAGAWSGYGHQSAPCLNAGLFIRGDNKIMAAQGFSFPDSLIQVQDPCGFWFEIWIPRPNPASVTPGADSILAQPAPDCFPADGSYNSIPLISVRR